MYNFVKGALFHLTSILMKVCGAVVKITSFTLVRKTKEAPGCYFSNYAPLI